MSSSLSGKKAVVSSKVRLSDFRPTLGETLCFAFKGPLGIHHSCSFLVRAPVLPLADSWTLVRVDAAELVDGGRASSRLHVWSILSVST